MTRTSPDFAVTLDQGGHAAADILPPDGTLLWPDISHVQIWGDYLPHEIHTAEHPLGRVAILGDCFADPETVQDALGQSLAQSDPTPITRLPGNYRAILLEGDTKTTVLTSLAGDPVYYNQNANSIGSRPSLVANGELLVPDLQYLTAQLVMADADGSLFSDRSSYHGVGRLTGGELIEITNGNAVVREYEPLVPVPGRTLAEAAVRVREALEAAVKARVDLGLPISADLSGGLDSSSISFLASNYLNPQILDVFNETVPGRPDGDSQYVSQFLQLNKLLKLRTIEHDAPQGYDNAAFERMPWSEDLADLINTSPHIQKNMRAYYGAIDKSGSQLHLNGFGGDEVVGASALYLADLLRSGHYGRFLRENMRWARLRNIAPSELLLSMARLSRDDAPRQAIDLAIQTLKDPATRHSSERIQELMPWQPTAPMVGWLTHTARQNLIDGFRGKAEDIGTLGQIGFGDMVAAQGIRSSGTFNHMFKHGVYGVSNVSPQSPFLDNDVVRAAYSIPAHLRGNPDAYKQLLRAALDGVVPDEVLARRSKGVYDNFYSESLRKSLPALRAVMENSRLADLGIIEPDRILEVLDGVDMASVVAVSGLDRIFAAERWLRGLENQPDMVIDTRSLRESTTVTTLTLVESKPNKQDYDPTVDPDQRYSVPVHVHAVASESGSLVLFNEHTNRYHPLEQTRSNILRAFVGGNLEQAVGTLTAAYPDAPPELLRKDAERCLQDFIKLGILGPPATISRALPTTARPADFEGTEMAKARGSGDEKVSWRNKVVAATALVVGELIVGKISPRARLNMLRHVQRIWTKHDATPEEGKRYLRAAQSLPHIGRLACSETAYTAALSAALERRNLTYLQGASLDPLDFHAWVAVNGEPVRTELDGQVTGAFQSFF